MQNIYFDQILFLTLQCFVVAFLLLTLFRLRTIFGLSLLLATLGVFQYMQVFLANALYFEIIKGVFVSSGTSVLFTGSLFAILLVYIKEDTQEARKLIYAILSANIVLSILQTTISLDFESEHILNIYNLPKELFSRSFRISATGAILIFIDTFLIIFIYELISKYTRSLFFRILIATIFILSIDSIIFAILGFYGTGQTQRILISGLISKNFAAIIFSIIFALYLKYNEKRGLLIDSNEKVFKDIFHTLTFRQKYEEIYAKSQKQEIALEVSDQKYKYFVEQTSEGFYIMECEKPISILLPVEEQAELIYQHLIIKECNDTYAQMRGYKNSQEIIGLRLKDLLSENNKTTNLNTLIASVKSNYKTIDAKTIALDLNNNKLHFLNNAVGIVADGMLTAIWGTQRDVTTQIKKELEIKRYASIVETSQDLMAFLDKNFIYLTVNESYSKAFNLTKDEITGLSVTQIFGKDFFEEVIKPEGKRCLKGENINYKKWFNFPALGSKYMDIRYSPFYDENNIITGFNVNARDITKSKIAEDKLIIANTIVNRSSSVAFLWKNDTKWTIEFVSENVLNLCGYSLKEFMEQKISYMDLIHPDDVVLVQQEVAEFSKNIAIQNFSHKPYRIISKNNKIKWVQDNTYIRRNLAGTITHYEGIVSDITERKNAAQILKINEEKYRTLFECAPEGILIANANGYFLDANIAMCEMLGLTHKELVGLDISSIVTPDEIKDIEPALETIRLTNQYSRISQFKRKDASIFSVELSVTTMPNGNLLALVNDITERKALETALLNEKTQLKAIVDNIPVMITMYDPDVNMLFLNNEFEKKVGITTKEAAEINIMEVIYPDLKVRKQAVEFYGKSLNEWKELPLTTIKGEIIDSEWTNIKLKNGIIIDIGIDITEKKKTQAELNKTKDILLNTLENMTDGFVSLNLDWNYNYVNKKAGEFFGRIPSSLINKNIWKEFPEGINQPFYKNYYKALETQKPIVFEDYYAPWDEWYENRIIPSENGLAIFFQNITERKNNEKALIEFNNRLELLNKVDSTILNSKDLNFIAEDILLELQKTIKYKRASLGEYISENNTFKISSVLSEDKISKPLINIVEVSKFNFLELDRLKSGEHQIIEDISALNISSPILSQLISIGITSSLFVPLISDKELIGILSLYYDTKEFLTLENIEISKEIANQLAIAINQHRLRNEILKYTEDLEEKIVERTEQLEFSNRELRDFAQIVSHDLKAPLRAISQLSYWISEDYADKIDDAGKEQLKMLIGRVKRLDNLIEGILQYSRAGRLREKEILMDLNVIVYEVINSLNPPKNIEINIDNKLPEVLGDPTRFGQVFQNLIANAIKYNDKSKGIINLGCSKQGDYWEFYISDNGPGIEEKYFDRIFQIFQRLETRDNLEGTGVGLSLVKRIIQIYNGEIWITSKVKEGATFHFTLPIKHYNN